MHESGDDLHFAFEMVDGAGFCLGAEEHECHGHRIAAGFRGGEIDGPAAAAAEFALDGEVVEKTGSETLPARTAARRHSHHELAHGFGRESGQVAFRQGCWNHGGVRRGFHAQFDGGLADGDAVAVFQVDARVLAQCALLRGFAFFAPAAFRAVDGGPFMLPRSRRDAIGGQDSSRKVSCSVREKDLEVDGGRWTLGRSLEGLRLRGEIVNLSGRRLEARRLQHGLRRDAAATFQEA